MAAQFISHIPGHKGVCLEVKRNSEYLKYSRVLDSRGEAHEGCVDERRGDFIGGVVMMCLEIFG